MSEFDINRVNELVVDEWIWVVFIILSILNIGGDELEKKYCYQHDTKIKRRAKKIFNLTVFVSFLIYFYLAIKNCKKYLNAKGANQDTHLISVRCFGSMLVVIASCMFLLAQLSECGLDNPSEE